jgi:hypothetical protein
MLRAKFRVEILKEVFFVGGIACIVESYGFHSKIYELLCQFYKKLVNFDIKLVRCIYKRLFSKFCLTKNVWKFIEERKENWFEAYKIFNQI